ncbi:MAG: hypothetical protein A3F35_01755 [Candidatus Woykebacteria bacterium RIFCSPHIGHO2_12_FULL_45_10]|uniref:CMP/dCMP-type deaminase domain-containing protein n=1 Tax=Candidatus Woykebacteria bacterium RIFCSPHIGHO2_12_FULL_45_10 TaxID=1802603 RepID=A0A1G1WSW5_9BACT|nr:MAG: hypothetical protein A3F35_01755 [Candidatus Woykebacteria bacterium RIFCSPHIGHO2_12_FULL_45_10]
MNQDEKFMRIAVEEAKLTRGPKRFGAVVVKDGEVVSKAHTTTHEKEDPTQHAEILAISEATRRLKSRRLTGCVVYASCEPCMMCVGAILWARINELVYAMSREDSFEAFTDSSHWHMGIDELIPKGFVVRKGILRQEAKEVFQTKSS